MTTSVNIKLDESEKFDIPNAETKAAIEEGSKLVADENIKRYNSVSELRADLDV